jgi:D-threo-aldose 1-dehydrogenase
VSDGWIRALGATGLNVSAVCAGGGPLGSMPAAFGYEVSESDAVDLVEQLLASPIRFLDTSNGYSDGESERRIGKGIERAGGLPADFLVATKVDALDGDYSGARVRESVRESKKRLGLESLPLVHLHDPEFHEFETLAAPGGAVETLVRLREEGEIGHIGVAGGDVHELAKYLDLGVFDVLLTHNRWTIVDRSAGPLIEQAIAGGVAILNAAIYGGGILAAPAATGKNYGYRPAERSTVGAIAAMAELSASWDTDLATVALQHSLRDDRISSTVVGFSKVSRIASIMDAAASPLPAEFWAELEKLVPDPSKWLDAK